MMLFLGMMKKYEDTFCFNRLWNGEQWGGVKCSESVEM